MKFYNRIEEINELEILLNQCEDSSKMTVLTGRRRVGKTALALEFTKNHKFLYFFISKKDEHLLCEDFLEKIKDQFNFPIIGKITNFRDIFLLLLEIAKKEKFTLIIDEFQEFYFSNNSIYSEIQNLWDQNKNSSKLNLIFIGSVYSLIHKIFQHSKEPLFGRSDRFLTIKPFSIDTTKEILTDYSNYSIKNLFHYFVFTGNIPRYLDILTTNSAFSFENIIDFIFKKNSPFIEEGKNLLIEEFGKEYGTYFSILELISRGKTARSEIESILEKQIGGYLDRLDKDYDIIKKHIPINAKPGSRVQKYKITDNFLNMWFRYIYKNKSAVETENFEYIKDILRRDFSTYSGKMLENFYHELFINSKKFNKVGSYWEKGNLNEIDLVAINDFEKKMVIAEIKLNKKKININLLKEKSKKLINDYQSYNVEYIALSLEEAEKYII